MDQTVNFPAWPSSTDGASLEMSIQRLSKYFGFIGSPNGAKAVLSELEKCFAVLPALFPRISSKSVELLVRMTICALQTQTTLDDNLREIICRGASCLKDKSLAQELLQETAPQTLAQNAEWIQVLQHQNGQQSADDQTFERISFCLENGVKLVAMAPEAARVFQGVTLDLFLGEIRRHITAERFLDSASPPKIQRAASLPKLDMPSTSTKMVEEIARPERLFTCDFCQKTFTLNLVQHIRNHTKGRPHKCNFCSMEFPYPSQLVRHIRTHTGEQRFACSVCHKGFTQSSKLKAHSRTHNGEKLYTCDVCNKSFVRKGNLNRHKRIHTWKASDLQLQGSLFGQGGVPNAFSGSATKQPSVEFVCNLPEQLAAMDLSGP